MLRIQNSSHEKKRINVLNREKMSFKQTKKKTLKLNFNLNHFNFCALFLYLNYSLTILQIASIYLSLVL